MNNRRRNVRHEAEQGFTLIEILLVLVLLTTIAGMAWPVLRNHFANRRLHSAADTVCSVWSHARVTAMRSGQTYAFRFAMGGNHYQLESQDEPGASASSSDAGQDEGRTSAAEAAPIDDDKTLPDGIKFVANGAAAGNSASPSVNEQENAGEDWSEPVLFFPDGTTSDARLVLTGNQGYTVRLELRGLTGTVTVGDVTSSVE
jgi:prepilin-type N-terminal cleavage/methylation domain-containing protein